MAITIDRNVISISRNASVSTNANTYGAACFSCQLESLSFAGPPVTPTSASWSLPTVAGMTVFRSVSSAASDFASVPSPCIASETSAIVPSGS